MRALRGYEKAWGLEHISTLDTVNNLGNLYSNQGKLVEAEKMYQRALEGYERLRVPTHPSTKGIRRNLSSLGTWEMKVSPHTVCNRLRRVTISMGATLALMLMHPQPMVLPPSSILIVCSSPNCQVETVICPGLFKRIFMEWARMYKRPEYITVLWRFLLPPDLEWFQWAMILSVYFFL